jgi:arabinofuranosyltransferase
MNDDLLQAPPPFLWAQNVSVRWAFLGLIVLFAASRTFILDDAFISLRYAENLAAGNGLVFNPGEWTEGYTNFSWTLLLSIPFLLGLDPVVFAHAMSLTFFLGSLHLTMQIADRLLGDPRLSFVAAGTLGLGQTFSAYGTSGLETQLQVCVLLWIVFMALKDSLEKRECVFFSLGCALAILTRPDGALPVAFWGLYVLWRHRGEREFRFKMSRLLVPGGLVLGVWIGFKLAMYGQLLPNTYYAKVGGSQDLAWGMDYLVAFSLATGLLPLGLLSPFWRRKEQTDAGMRPIWCFCVLWSLYVASVGGDFMEYRFMVCVIPLLILLILESVKRWPAIVLALGVTVVGWSYAAPLEWTHRAGVEDIETLGSHLTQPVQDWEGVGKQLRLDLPDGSDVLVATTAAGAIPFYSKLPSLDMLGLTDAQVAHEGELFEAQRNHTRVASLGILKDRRVNLMLGQPWLRRPGPRRHYPFQSLRGFQVFTKLNRGDLPETTRIVEIPLPDGGGGERVLIALYLHPHPDVEALIRQGVWRFYPLI